MTQDIDPKLVERMVALVRELAVTDRSGPWVLVNFSMTAKNIVAEMPEPVDPDLLLAREVASVHWGSEAHRVISGEMDNAGFVAVALAAIKRARATP